MHYPLHTLTTTLLLISTTQALFLPSTPLPLLPSVNLTLPTLHNSTTTHLNTIPWPPTPFTIDLHPPPSHLLIISAAPRIPDSTDFDEDICGDIGDIVARRLSRKTADVIKTAVKERSGRVSFTVWPGKEAGVTRREVVQVLEQFWFATAEFGAATIFGRLVVGGFERAEVGLLLN